MKAFVFLIKIFFIHSLMLSAVAQTLGELKFKTQYFKDSSYNLTLALDSIMLYQEHIYLNTAKRETIASLINGRENGHYLYRYANGKIKRLRTYVYGVEAGQWFAYDSNGVIKEYEEFSFEENDIFLDSSFYLYDPLYDIFDGEVKEVGIACTGPMRKLPSTKVRYYSNGSPRVVQHYKKNKRDGEWLFYDEKKKLIYTEKYVDGILISQQSHW